jgi:acetoacetyl-CoA synthetase
MTQPLWQPLPEDVARAPMTDFMRFVERHRGVATGDYPSLHRWSVDHREAFWLSVWDYCGVIAEQRGERAVVNGTRMPGARWFPDARLNFAENLLRRNDDSAAIVFRGEDRVASSLSWAGLHHEVSRFQQGLAALGIAPGDRVAAYMPNIPGTVVAMLAATSLGAVWSSCSPDFGVQGVLDRFSQIEPRVLVAADGYFYNGKHVDVRDRIAEIVSRLPSVERVVIVPYTSGRPDITRIPRAIGVHAFMSGWTAKAVTYARLPFNHPLYILYSSGTTGVPKCIVHGAGGTLLQHLKEHRLHVGLEPGERIFYYTTCGWMMWNWLVTALASRATIVLYDGAPTYPNGAALFDLASQARINVLGTSAKFIDAIAKAGIKPIETHVLDDLRLILSTGSPLAPEGFDYVYRDVKPDVALASMSGGTDLIACFVNGCPLLPVWRGEIQAPALGMQVAVFDEDGRSLPPGEKGELVCTAPFPSMPIGFWNDPDGGKYRSAYFDRFPNVWCHGDYVAFTEHGGMVIYGRSDATLNPGGVRIGTAEIYRQVESLDEIVESLVIGQDWPPDRPTDTRIVLFVRLRPGTALDAALEAKIRDRIRTSTTPRHVPARIVEVADIPRTKSGKIVELAVRHVVHGRPVKNIEALANPEALAHFRDRPELAG